MYAILRSVKIFLLAVIVIAFITFAIANREIVHLSFFPLPWTADLPHFLLALMYFSFGALVGGLAVGLQRGSSKRRLKADHKRIEALENEINALHTQTGTPSAPAHL